MTNSFMSSNAKGIERSICPFLGIIDEAGNPAPYVDYPSFENRCFSDRQPEAVMLTDQATFCLAAGYRHCPRLAAARGQASPGARDAAKSHSRPPRAANDRAQTGKERPAGADPLQRDIEEMEAELQAAYVSKRKSRRRWGWIGAIAIFVSSLVCGSTFAGYVGWRLVGADLFTVAPGAVDTVAAAPTPAQPQVYLIVTATGEAQPEQAAATAPTNGGQILPVFPAAVTPTPGGAFVSGSQAGLPAQSGPIVLATSPINMQLEVPTRRPTPILDLVIAGTPTPEASATLTPTPTPALGTPAVIFAAHDAALEEGDCTIVSWHVENVRAVYYENLGVDGHGEQEECIRDKPGDYTLTVVLPNGATQYYTTTVALIRPTETPTPTPTFPPEVIPTATWTPIVPTNTPTPDYQYGVLLATESGNRAACQAGGACRIGLLITNTSIVLDNISISVVNAGKWPRKLCRMDGVCSDAKLTLASVGPGNTALVYFSVEIPPDASSQTEAYVVRALSEGSQGAAGSDAITLEMSVD